MSELNMLYDLYMDRLEEQIAVDAALHAAESAMRATPEYQAWETAREKVKEAGGLTDSALDAVKTAVVAAFQETGERQPHPYAGIMRVDTRARYNSWRVLQWLKARPDYKQFIVPESVDVRGFEKLARALDKASAPMFWNDNGIEVPLVEWDEIPVVSVKIRED